MTEFGKARPAQHTNLSAKFGGLLPKNEPTPVPAEESIAPEAPVTVDTAAQEQTEPVMTPSVEASGEKPAAGTSSVGRRKPDSKNKAEPSASLKVVPAPLTTAAPAGDDKADQPIQISLPISLEARLSAFKSKTGLSHPNILFDAIEDTAERLPDLVKAKTVQLGTSTGPSLFSRPQTAVKRDTSTAEPKKSFIIRITKQNKSVLDDLVRQLEAPNRTVLIVAAYDEYLP